MEARVRAGGTICISPVAFIWGRQDDRENLQSGLGVFRKLGNWKTRWSSYSWRSLWIQEDDSRDVSEVGGIDGDLLMGSIALESSRGVPAPPEPAKHPAGTHHETLSVTAGYPRLLLGSRCPRQETVGRHPGSETKASQGLYAGLPRKHC